MNKINFFSNENFLYPYRWIIVCSAFSIGFMLYHDLMGGRMFSSSGQQQWSNSGTRFHK